MLFNRRQFLIASTVFAAGCSTQNGTNYPSGSGERIVNVGPAGLYSMDGVYTKYRNQGFFLVRRGTTFFAISAICTHRKCKLEREQDDTFYCPCHGSIFDADGKVTKGPARRNLPAFGLSTDEKGDLVVKIPAA
jgi:Rieske Fe-S protein